MKPAPTQPLPPLVAAYYTLAGIRPFENMGPSPHDLRSRIEAAAAAGYSGIGVDAADLAASIERYGHAGIKAMLADNGLSHFEVEGIGEWYAQGPYRAASDAVRRLFYETAEKIGLAQFKVTGNVAMRSVPVEQMRAAYAQLVREAKDAGTRVTLEMVAISDVADLETAIAVIGDTVGQGGGLCADIWHFMRGGVGLDALAAAPRGLVGWVELDDGADGGMGSIISEMLDNRRLPGEGDFDIAGFLSAIAANGYDGAMGVEILSDELRALDVNEAARRSYAAAAAQFDQAVPATR